MATIRCLNQQFESIQAVLFDKDGTLANVESYLRALGEARSHFIDAQVPGIHDLLMTAFGIPNDGIDPTGLMAVGSRYENEIAAAAYVAATGKGWIDALALVNIAFHQAEVALTEKSLKTPLIVGAKRLLQRLELANVKIGIVSSDTHVEVASFIDRYQLSEISWYRGVTTDALTKTHPDFLAFACREMEVDAADTLVVGDAASDLQLALQGAAGFIGMTGGWCYPPVISLAGRSTVDLAIATVSQLDQVESFD